MSLAAFQRQHEEHARRLLEKAVPESAAAYCKTESMLVRGKPSRKILRIASDRQHPMMVHATLGWCPPSLWFRPLGFRTRFEIQAEREALLRRLGELLA